MMEVKTKGGIVDEAFLLEVAGKIAKEWLDIGRFLKIPEARLQHLKDDYRNNLKEAIFQMLLSWRQKEGSNATHRVLAGAFQKANRKDLEELTKEEESKNPPVQQIQRPIPTTMPARPTPKHGGLQSFVNQEGRHNLVVGCKHSLDVVLHRENVRKHGTFGTLFQQQTHDFTYSRKPTETITAILVKDNWDDDTGGIAKVIHGGPGKNSVKVTVTSQRSRGMDFTFTVYGRKQATS